MGYKTMGSTGPPYIVVKPTHGAIAPMLRMFANVLTPPLRDGATIRVVYRECDGRCRKDRDVVITQQLAIQTPGMLWFGCLDCGTQNIIRTDKPDDLFYLPPEEQKFIVESTEGRYYRCKLSERVIKHRQKERELLVKKADKAMKRIENPKLR